MASTVAIIALGNLIAGKHQSRWPELRASPSAKLLPAAAPEPGFDMALCVMPAINGEPLPADLNEIERMISGVTTVPGQPWPSIYPFNRGGHYTVDETGAFVPFDGPVPETVVQEPDGRYVAVDRENLLIQDPGSITYRTLGHSEAVPDDYGHLHMTVARLPRLSLTLFGDRDKVFALRGDELVAWSEVERMQSLGIIGLKKAVDLPTLAATLVQSSNQILAVRLDDGQWIKLEKLDTVRGLPGSDAEEIRAVIEAPNSSAALIRTNNRDLILEITPDSQQKEKISFSVSADYGGDHSQAQLFASKAVG